jgi:hypothetical protein
LFADSLRAGQRAAAVMSLIQSAKLNGHDPHAYLKDVLTRLPTHMNSRNDELLPHRWSPAWCPHVHDKTVDTYLLAEADKRKSRWGGRTLTEVEILTFPTIVIANSEGKIYFAGPIEPRLTHLQRLLQSMDWRISSAQPSQDWEDFVHAIRKSGSL